MARGINKVILVGNLGADPEVKQLTSGVAANLRVATTKAWTDRSSGEKQERTEWHRVVLFDKLAEIAGEYLQSGSQVYLEGELRTRKWTDADGVDHYPTEIVATEMQMLGGKPQQDNSKPAPAGKAEAAPKAIPPKKPVPKKRSPKKKSLEAEAESEFASSDFDDDIPF